MQLHQVKSKFKKKNQKRVGRGGKRGTTAGRGTKGQKSRSGRRIRKAERDLVLRTPKRRGFRNKPQSAKPVILSLGALEAAVKPYVSSKTSPLLVDRNLLEQAGVIKNKKEAKVKILSGGNVTFAITLKDISVSKSALEKIKKSGGGILEK